MLYDQAFQKGFIFDKIAIRKYNYVYIYAVMRSDMTKHDKCSDYTLENTVYGGLSIGFGAHSMCFGGHSLSFRGYCLCSVGHYYDINFILENIYVRIVKLLEFQ